MNKFLMLVAAAFTFAFAAPAIADNHGHEKMTEEKAVEMMDETVTEEVCHNAEGDVVECPEVMDEDVDTDTEAEADEADHADHMEEKTMEESAY